jgi:hypothetical protein
MGIRVMPNETVPASVYKILLPHERRVITVRYHPAILLPQAAVAAGGLLAAVALWPVDSTASYLSLGIWLLAALLVFQALTAVYSWLECYLAVTIQRLITPETGFLFRGVRHNVPLAQLQDIRLVRSLGGRILGYGTLVCQSAGVTIGYIPYPEQLYIEITGLLFKDPDSGDD